MSRTKDEKNAFSGCCPPMSNTTPENSISEDSIEESDNHPANNNTMFHTPDNGKPLLAERMDGSLEHNFPKRLAVDVEFQNIRYTVGKFSFRNRKFGELAQKNID